VRRNYPKKLEAHVPEFAKRIIAQYQLPKVWFCELVLLVLGQIETQGLIGGAMRRQSILGFSVLVRLATAI
jgi:hypothetical protein